MSQGTAVAAGPPAGAHRASTPARRAVEVYGPPAAPGRGGGRRPPRAGLRTRRTGTSVALLRLDRANGHGCPRASAARRTWRTSSCSSPARRSREHRRPPPVRAACAAWSGPPSPACWCARSSTSRPTGAPPPSRSTVEPTIYLLAFGFGFGSLVSEVGGYPYVEFVGTGTVATAVLFSSAFPAMFGTLVKRSSSAPTTRSWPRRSTPRSWSRPRRCGSRVRAGDLRLRADARGDVLRARPELGDARGAVHRVRRRLRLGRASASRSRRGWTRSRTSATSSARC